MTSTLEKKTENKKRKLVEPINKLRVAKKSDLTSYTRVFKGVCMRGVRIVSCKTIPLEKVQYSS
jgi:hypothetical protein